MLLKNDIVERLRAKGYTKKDSELIIDDFISVLEEALTKGEDIRFHGFGTFAVRESKEHVMVDVTTKEKMIIPSRKVPKFIPSPGLKELVRTGIWRE